MAKYVYSLQIPPWRENRRTFLLNIIDSWNLNQFNLYGQPVSDSVCWFRTWNQNKVFIIPLSYWTTTEPVYSYGFFILIDFDTPKCLWVACFNRNIFSTTALTDTSITSICLWFIFFATWLVGWLTYRTLDFFPASCGRCFQLIVRIDYCFHNPTKATDIEMCDFRHQIKIWTLLKKIQSNIICGWKPQIGAYIFYWYFSRLLYTQIHVVWPPVEIWHLVDLPK